MLNGLAYNPQLGIRLQDYRGKRQILSAGMH